MKTLSFSIEIEPEVATDKFGSTVTGYTVIRRERVEIEERDLEPTETEESQRIKRMADSGKDDMEIARRVGISLRKVRAVLKRDAVDRDENWQEPAIVSRIIAFGLTEQEARRIKRDEERR